MTPWALVLAITFASLEHGLPPGLMVAVAIAESNGRWQVSHERAGGCSAGPLQVYHDDCRRRFRPRDLVAHVDTAAQILASSRRTCAAHPRWRDCRLPSGCVWGLFNGGSRTWCGKVLRIWRGLIGRHPARAAEVPDA